MGALPLTTQPPDAAAGTDMGAAYEAVEARPAVARATGVRS
jgi:hypothetical protein